MDPTGTGSSIPSLSPSSDEQGKDPAPLPFFIPPDGRRRHVFVGEACHRRGLLQARSFASGDGGETAKRGSLIGWWPPMGSSSSPTRRARPSTLLPCRQHRLHPGVPRANADVPARVA